METTMTLSHLADLIIVISFFSICGAGLGTTDTKEADHDNQLL